MRLYAGTSKQFIEDNVQNQIAEKLKQSSLLITALILPLEKSIHGETLSVPCRRFFNTLNFLIMA
jgi:hypothetical protein